MRADLLFQTLFSAFNSSSHFPCESEPRAAGDAALLHHRKELHSTLSVHDHIGPLMHYSRTCCLMVMVVSKRRMLFLSTTQASSLPSAVKSHLISSCPWHYTKRPVNWSKLKQLIQDTFSSEGGSERNTKCSINYDWQPWNIKESTTRTQRSVRGPSHVTDVDMVVKKPLNESINQSINQVLCVRLILLNEIKNGSLKTIWAALYTSLGQKHQNIFQFVFLSC